MPEAGADGAGFAAEMFCYFSVGFFLIEHHGQERIILFAP